MSNIEISNLRTQNLKNGEYRKSFPEYYQLQTVVENSLWHDHQNVFEHVVNVFENLESEISYVPQKVTDYLKQKIGNQNRLNILKVATLLHDIAKKETLIVNKDQAGCPGHEHIAAGQCKNFKELFSLDQDALNYVERIVLHHGFISDILTQVLNEPGRENQFWTFFVDTVGDIWYELLLLMHADLNGCDLKTTAPEQYLLREALLNKWLESKINLWKK